MGHKEGASGVVGWDYGGEALVAGSEGCQHGAELHPRKYHVLVVTWNMPIRHSAPGFAAKPLMMANKCLGPPWSQCPLLYNEAVSLA